MKFELDDFSAFLKDCISPVIAYSRLGAMVDPIVTIEAGDDMVTVASSQHNRFAMTLFPAKVSKKGLCHVPANTLSAIRSRHKNVTLTVKDSKLIAGSSQKGGEMELKMDTVGKSIAPIIDQSKKAVSVSLSAQALKRVLGSISITPILAPSREEAYFSMYYADKKLNYIIQDSSRLAHYEIKSKKKDTPEVTTSFAEIQAAISIADALSEEITFKFGKKAIEIEGSTDDFINTKTRANYSAPNDFMLIKAKTIVSEFRKAKEVSRLTVTSEFKSVLESVLGLTAMRKKQAHVDITFSKKKVLIQGLGPLSSYSESITCRVKGKDCRVRLSSNVMADITKYFEDDVTEVILTEKGFLIENSSKKAKSTFILPFLSISYGD